MKRIKIKAKRHAKRKKGVGSALFGTKERPRLSVYRSNSHIYAQIVDDVAMKTLVSASDLKVKKGKMNKTQLAEAVGEALAKDATKNKITTVIFDRNGFIYHGRVKALAEGARKGGLKF